MAKATTAKAYRGILESTGSTTCKLRQMEYMLGAIFAVTLRARSTVKKFPNPPAGERIDWSSPPILPSSPYAADQAGTAGIAAANAAPSICIDTCRETLWNEGYP